MCIDLCAAPGGWCQVAAKLMPSGSIVLGVDLLPIRAIRNVKTLVQDITTAECRRQITSELHGWQADVVLCDGAPNIGSAYQKDAYVQNELVLAALKTATDHLVAGGTFVTKVYRSKDYNALMWVLQQFFVDVQAMKPNSSRSQSAEIFLVGLQYLAPSVIDPKLLDPNHVFKEVVDPSTHKTVDVMHKKYDLHNKRNRSGYDEEAGVLLSKSCTVTEFVHCKDPVRVLTDMTFFRYTDECKSAYENHPATNEDIVTSFKDLKVLGRIDFKKLLKWRLLMKKASKEETEETQVTELSLEESDGKARRARDVPLTEDEIQEEILKQRERMERQTRKQKKHTRLQAAKERKRQALGMNSDSFGVQEDVELFSLADKYEGGASNKRTMEDLEGIGEVDLDDLESDFDNVSEGDEDQEDNFGLLELDDDGLEAELESEYLRFAQRARAKKAALSKEDVEDDIREGVYDAALSTKKAKKRATSEAITAQREQQDQDEFLGEGGNVEEDLQEYARMLSGGKVRSKKLKKGEDEESSADDDSDDDSDEDDEEESARPPKKRRGNEIAEGAIPVSSRDTLSVSAKASKWFANPIFKESIVTSSGDNPVPSAPATTGRPGKGKKSTSSEPVDSDNEEAALEHLKNLEMPLTDKQLRQQKRKKDMEKKARKDEKRQRALMSLESTDGMFSTGIEIAPADDDDDDVHLDQETLAMRSLIRKGMGKQGKGKEADASKPFEIAPAVSMVDSEEEYGNDEESDGDQEGGISRSSVEFTGERMDSRTYDSDEEVYDNRDRAMTLALGTMMLRKSRKKALVDASYNRYAWNDPKDLPSWFLDDEMRHNRPQLPVPNALLEQVSDVVHMEYLICRSALYFLLLIHVG